MNADHELNHDDVSYDGNIESSILLDIRNLSVRHGKETILRNFFLDIKYGEIVSIVGVNGSGKSTLVNTISGIEKFFGASVSHECFEYKQEDLTTISAQNRYFRGIHCCFEDRQLVGSLSVKENLALALGREEKQNINSRVDEIIERFPLIKDILNNKVKNCSGGQQQLIAIAKAIMVMPSLLILDEPSRGLSSHTIQEVYDLLRSLVNDSLSILICEQRLRFVEDVSTRVLYLDEGQLLERPTQATDDVEAAAKVKLTKDQNSEKELVIDLSTQHPISLSCKNISKQYLGINALNSVSFEVKAGGRLGIMGDNGAGKSTLCDIITGLISPSSGIVSFDDKDITNTRVLTRANRGLRRVFQHPVLFDDLSIQENIMIGAMPRASDGFFSSLFAPRFSYKEQYEKVNKIMEYCEIENDVNIDIARLSHSVQKRIELARSFMGDPRLLILDEPAASMRESEKDEYSQIILNYFEKFNTTLIVVEHDMSFIDRLCKSILILERGSTIFYGDLDEAKSDPNLIEMYK